MTKKARNTASPPNGSGPVADTAATAPDLQAYSAVDLAEVKKQLEKSLRDWEHISLGLIGPSATKELLYNFAKLIHVPGGRPKKPFHINQFVKALGSYRQKSTKAVREENGASHNTEKTRKARQREYNEATNLMLNILGALWTPAIELGYMTNDAGRGELIEVLKDKAKCAAVFKRALQR